MIRERLKSRLVADTGWVIFGQAATAALLLLGIRLLTEVVPPEVYGNVALIMSLVSLAANACAMPFTAAGERFLPEMINRHQVETLRLVLMRQAAPLLACAAVLLIAAGAVFPGRFGAGGWTLTLAAALLVATAYREFELHLLIANRRHKEANLWQTSEALVRPLMAVAAVLVLGVNPFSVLLGYLLAVGLLSLVWRPKTNQIAGGENYAPLNARDLVRRIRAYSWPLIPVHLVCTSFESVGNRIIISFFVSPGELGLYVAAQTLIHEAFRRAATALERLFRPVHFQQYAHSAHAQADRTYAAWTASLVVVCVCGVLLVMLLDEWLVTWVFAETYWSAAGLMPLLAAGSALYTLGKLFQQPLLSAKRTGVIMAAGIIGTAAALVAVPLLVWQFGLWGAALAWPVYTGLEVLVVGTVAKPWRIIFRVLRAEASIDASRTGLLAARDQS
jgi:O-antigen/teichoic acid export membrane protein